MEVRRDGKGDEWKGHVWDGGQSVVKCDERGGELMERVSRGRATGRGW